MVVRAGLSLVFALFVAATVAAIQQGPRIEPVEGQDAAYVAGQGASTAAIVEVRGANGAPMANALVTFAIMPADTKLVSFANGLMRIGVMTDANGRATATGLLPLAAGPFSIQASLIEGTATTASTTLNQVTYATAADAIRNARPNSAPPAASASPAPAPVSQAPPAQMAANDLGLQIVVISGEDGVNIIQQKTAVQPVIEVRDKNNLPVGGVLVTFGISGVGGGASPAAFANGLSRIGVMTDSAGRASVQGLQALGRGAFNLDITASFQGQTVSRTLAQSNFQTIAEAISAGKTPTAAQGASQASGSQASNTGSQSSNAGSQGSNAGSNAGSQASSAGSSASSSAAGSAAAGGGGIGGGAIAGIAVAGVGAAGYGAYKLGYLDAIFPVCKAEEDAAINAANSINYNSYYVCLNNSRTTSQDEACFRQYAGAFFDALGDWCACGGNKWGDADRAAFNDLVESVRQLGGNTSSLSRCGS